MTAPRPLVGVVADDITGAGDIGGLFAKHGYAVRVFTAETDLDALPAHLRGQRVDVIVVDTDSRLETPAVAYERVHRATRALQAAACTAYWKKTCSVFRGNVGQEFDAMLDALHETFGITVAAFPKNGRATIHAEHFVRGAPLNESEFRHDPVHPRTESNLVRVLETQTSRRVTSIPIETIRDGSAATRAALDRARAGGTTYALCDAATQDDLRTIAEASARERVYLGSSALAEELPAVWDAPKPYDPLEHLTLDGPPGVLAVAGSVMPQTRAQLDAFTRHGGHAITLDAELALANPDAAAQHLANEAAPHLKAGRDVAIRSDNTPEAVTRTRDAGARHGLAAVDVSRTVSRALAAAARLTLDASGARRLAVLGGDTSAAACRELGITETIILHELEPGLPSSVTTGGTPLLLVLKSGSFGGPNFLNDAIAHLRALGGHA